MNKLRILYTSTQVRNAITHILGDPQNHRVVITAFVGKDASAFLPRPEGIYLVCWPHAGGTNPDALRELMRRGVTVCFSDRLHMKVYWSESKGAVLTSANLSTNALGSGDLSEAGVIFPPGVINIDRFLETLKTYPATPTELRKLDKAHKKFHTGKARFSDTGIARTYAEWYELPGRSTWKLGSWQSSEDASKAAKKQAHDLYGVKSPNDFIGCRPNQYTDTDWILSFRSTGSSVSEIRWIFVNFVVRVSPSEKRIYSREYPCQAVQVHSKGIYPTPPFATNKAFILAFKKAVKKYGLEDIVEKDITTPPARLLKILNDEYKA